MARSRQRSYGGNRAGVSVRLRAPVEREAGERPVDTGVVVFDENDVMIGISPVRRGRAALTLPREYEGQMVRVFHGPLDEDVEQPTPARLRRNLALEERVLVWPDLTIDLSPAISKLWRRSCCRVRGRVFVKVRLPNGTTQERPLCNARVVICEVDSSIPWIIRRLPTDLVYRLRDEWLASARSPDRGPDGAPALQVARAGVRLALAAGGAAATAAFDRLVAVERAVAVDTIREGLIANVDLLRPFWCDFEWLDRFYRVDCIRTVDVDDLGNFDTEIWYPCYGDQPDLYFRVEQDCHPGGWLTVHAPTVHCHTHWDYCCGTPVSIEVTHPSAVPGRAPAPCTWPYVAGDPASVGTWQVLPYNSGVFVVHAALLPTGKVLMWSGTAERNLPRESRVWDPDTGAMTTQTFADDLFCSGHAMLPDGRVLVNGGAIPGQGAGIKATHIFDPVAETWTKVRDMNHARWYPTTLTLPDGRVITFSGRDETSAVVPQVEVYDAGANTWTDLPVTANKTLEIYPSLHVMPDGKILYTGTRWGSALAWMSPPASAVLDLATNSWTDVDDHEVPNRTEAFSVQLPARHPRPAAHEHEDMPGPPPVPPTLSRILVCGGPGDQRSAEIIDMADAAPAWHRIADMNFPRTNVNGVILPDGTVLFCSGIDGYKWGPNTPTLRAEIFDPEAETWTAAAAMTVARQYHSVSILLPDGRVLNTGSVGGPGGGTNLLDMEVYSPPYLFRGPRPAITAAPTSVGYGAEFVLRSPAACRVDGVVLVRASTITHHTNTDQRYLRLDWRRDGRCDLRARAPADANVAPPGAYLLFLLDDCGVPSVGRPLRVG
jgi:Domain of unknown function (DUF1929)/Glyoxal oxidase N-terminus